MAPLVSGLTFSVRVNNDLDPDEYATAAAIAEDAGFDQIWVSNDLMLHSALAMLPLAVARTSHISLGIGVLNPYTIHTAEMAMFFRTLGSLAGHRLLLGLAAGAEDFLGWVGIARERPLREVERGVTTLRYLFGDSDTVPESWDPSAPRLPPGGPIPIYIGAMSPKMLRLAGRVGDGVLPLLFPPERYAEARQLVLEGAAGREIDVAACIWCSVDSDEAAADSALAARIAYYGPSFSKEVLGGLGLEPADLMPARRAVLSGRPEEAGRLLPSDAMRLGISGGTRKVVERCQSLLSMGATHLSFGPPLGPSVPKAIRLLGREVIPLLSSDI